MLYFRNNICMCNDLLVCINNYNKDENAIKLYKMFSEHFKCFIVDTYHLDNGGEILVDNVRYVHNVYCGGLFQADYELFKEGDYKYLLIVESDVVINDVEIINRIKMVINDEESSVYAYSPSLLQGSSCEGTTRTIIQNSYGFNNLTGRMRDSYRIEGWFALYHKDVVNSVLSNVTFENNKYGWFVHEACCRYAIKHGKRCVIDDVVSVYHTPGCGYCQAEALKIGEAFKENIFSKLDLYYIDEK